MTTQKFDIKRIPQFINTNSTYLEIMLESSDNLEIVDKIEFDDLHLSDYPNINRITFHIYTAPWCPIISPLNLYPPKIKIYHDYCDRKLFIPKNISTIKFTGCPYTRIHGVSSQKIENLIFDLDYDYNLRKIFTNIEKIIIKDKIILNPKNNPVEIPDKWIDINNRDTLTLPYDSDSFFYFF
ncbi:hypothetical protein QJ850_gp916 [Acanthamoeba polyphaga mimivirus]|uniref:Uncharacterized protein n=1 Tax=Acanthamoeba polyphaga mimivirus Kroon TaxID=3069720 RepID=A0A0G2Y228_9VIRU|nr:hypothetical protein QJ850_gp916 [Acanthamoeba polyphaga mimivirus]AKI79783.1 hypothetical protein [Acanthamoeba polyphaga mimivirus Kroon]